MNNFKHIFKLFAFGAISVLILSCSDDDTFIEKGSNSYEQGLIIEPSLPSMEGDFTATRADEPGVPELNENYLGENIDVFITETGQEQIIKTYHYNGEVTDNAEHLLAKNWQNQGLDVNKKYDVYVALNNPQTHQKNGDEYVVFNTLADLRALYTTDDQIFKPYGNDQWDEQADKVFMMDGVAKQWQPVAGQAKQVIPVEMRRAATKIVVSVNFDDEFIRSLDSLSINDPDHSINVGSPRWKHANFAYNTTDFGMDYGEGTTNQLTGDDRNLQTPTGTHWNITSVDREVSYTDIQTTPETANLRKTYTYLTYTYAFSWDETSNAMAEAPYTILTLGFTPKNQAMAVNYYRIPVVKESEVTEIKRNHVYHINANIKGMGSSSPTENTFESVDLQYEVLPWVKNESDVYDMITSKSYFLMVSPLNANLYGNNGEIDINYFITKGERIKITNAQVYFYNSSGTKTYLNATFPTGTTNYSNSPSSVAYTGNVTTTYSNNTTVTIDTANGLIHVNSPVLANKAVKYIKFTVSMVSGLTDQTFDVTVIHYPIENIQNFEGQWSSRWNGNNTTSTIREYSWDPNADGWSSYDGTETVPFDTYIEGVTTKVEATPTTEGAHRENHESNIQRATFTTAVPDRTSRWNAYDESHAVKGNDGYYYWGTQPSHGTGTTGNATSADYDYSRDGWWDTYYYMLTNVNRAKYYVYNRTRYYRDVTVSIPSTGNWVAWQSQSGTNTDGNFTAKYWYGGNNNPIRQINTDGTSYTTNSQMRDLNNNHMYVIQITAASNQFALGNPNLDNNYQSEDHVVSPAFMIASQLGAVSRFNNDNTYQYYNYKNGAQAAAWHCGRYMEVGTDGTRYVGWRLPTKEEINVIITYQNDNSASETITKVLSGAYYWTLDGTAASVSGGDGGTSTNAYVRCIRDLTDDDLKRLAQQHN